MQLNIAKGSIHAVLFDLDGTLVDTAPDLANALNFVLRKHDLDELEYQSIRPYVSYGADGLIKQGFGDQLTNDEQKGFKAELIAHYQENIAHQSSLFDGLERALKHLEKTGIKWGIVTNKPAYLTAPLLQLLKLQDRADCVVCGDEVAFSKPHPESIQKACELIDTAPEKTIYIGDAERDIQAGNTAGSTTIACKFGYIPSSENINHWLADVIVEQPTELSDWLLTLN